mmetsp:Transcript_14005/g.35226  ORF Transcript_14005/g.35226 Transcript_14005/m.35226 type:complete len:763 (+) Transcript_14005:311-2599(+)
MSDQTIDVTESGNSPRGTLQAEDDTAYATGTTASPITPTPVKKSKRQAKRMARGAFAATLRKEEEESRLYLAKKTKTKKRLNPSSDSNNNDNNNEKGKTKLPLSDGEASKEDLQVVTPQPTKSMNSATISSVKKQSKASSPVEPGSQNAKRSRDKNKISSINRKRRKLVYKAISNPKQPIYGYALDLVSLVCNNAYSVTKNSNGTHKKSASKTSSSPKNNNPPNTFSKEDRTLKCTQQPHMVLDRPSNGFTEDSEPIKERIMRLQLRQRFAAATSVGMSPIEFARKLLKLWGGTLEQVYETTKYTNDKSNKKSSSKKAHVKNGESNSSERKNNNCSSSTKKNRPRASELSKEEKNELKSKVDLTATISVGFRNIDDNNGLRCEVDLAENNLLYQPNSNDTNAIFDFQQNNIPTTFDVQSFGESTDRIKRSKKLLERRHRKNLKKAEGRGLASSLDVDPTKTSDCSSNTERIDREKPMITSTMTTSPSSSKRKPVKRIPRKLTDDPSVPVLFKDLRLSHPDDEKNLNALHCFVRAKLLEVYVLQGGKESNVMDSGEGPHGNENKYKDEKLSGKETPNIVGVRCVFCGSLPRQERGKGQSMSTFFPKSMGEIYRGVCTWQRIHFPVCEHMPEDYRAEYRLRKERDLTRGRKAHWVMSAYDLGLRNIDSERNGLTYKPGSTYNLEEVLKIEVDPGGRSSKAKRSLPSSENKASLPTVGKTKGSAVPTVVATSGVDEFELFGTEFDRSLQESTDAVANTKRDETAF